MNSIPLDNLGSAFEAMNPNKMTNTGKKVQQFFMNNFKKEEMNIKSEMKSENENSIEISHPGE
jgi:hypothetical protein